METDPNNEIVKLCAQGMDLEGKGKKEEAMMLFEKAWNSPNNTKEKFIAVHYVARHQKNVSDN